MAWLLLILFLPPSLKEYLPFAIVLRVGVEMEMAHARLRRQEFEGEFASLAARGGRARGLNAVTVQVQRSCTI